MPRQIRFIGGDDFAAGLAAVFSLFGVKATVYLSHHLETALTSLAEAAGVRICSHAATQADIATIPPRPQATITRTIDCRRQIGFTDHLNLQVIGVEPDENGLLWCSSSFETWCQHVFGIGDVVGFGSATQLTPVQQAERVLHRISHQIRPPHFSRSHLRIARFADVERS